MPSSQVISFYEKAPWIGSLFQWKFSATNEFWLMLIADCLANYEICRNVHAHGAIRFDDVKTEDQCKARCLMEDECKAVDWK